MRSRLLLIVLIAVASAFGANPPNLNEWTAVSAGGWSGVAFNRYDRLEYVANIQKHCIWGAYKVASITSEHNQGMFCYSYAENSHGMYQMGGSWAGSHVGNSGHDNSSLVYASDLGAVLHYSGDGSGSNTPQGFLGALWLFDPIGLTGQEHATAYRPWNTNSGTPVGAGAYDAATHQYFHYPAFTSGGANALGVCDVTTWVCTTAAISGTAPASTMANFSMRLNPDDGLIYAYGGMDASVYTLNPATKVWNKLTTTCTGTDCVGGNPPARRGAGFAYSTVDHVFLMAGGANCASGFGCSPSTEYSDTWTLNPATLQWTEKSPTAGYPHGTGGDASNTTFDRLSFDPVSNVFLLGIAPNLIYSYAISTPLAYGRTSNTYAPTAGSLNLISPTTSDGSWAFDPALTVSGSTIYMGHVETGNNADTTNCGLPHPTIRSTPNTGTYSYYYSGAPSTSKPSIASNCAAIDAENSSAQFASKLQIAVVNGTLWEAHEKMASAVTTTTRSSRAWAKQWTGTAWSGNYVGCVTDNTGGACNNGSGQLTQIPTALIASGTTPTLGVIEWDNGLTSVARTGWAYVMQYISGSWSALGGKLNITQTDGSRALSLALASDGTNPAACWIEAHMGATDRRTQSVNPQLQCAQWNGSSAWTRFGSVTLNQNSANFASDPAMTYVGGKFYIAWTERAVGGVNKLYLCRWDGSSCTLIGGGALNSNATTGWAAHASLSNDGTNVYVAWEEQIAIGQRSLGYVKKWDGASITALGSGIAADPLTGSVEGISIGASASVRPTVAFAELKAGVLRQSYALQWDGASWGALGGSPAPNNTSSMKGTVAAKGAAAVK